MLHNSLRLYGFVDWGESAERRNWTQTLGGGCTAFSYAIGSELEKRPHATIEKLCVFHRCASLIRPQRGLDQRLPFWKLTTRPLATETFRYDDTPFSKTVHDPAQIENTIGRILEIVLNVSQLVFQGRRGIAPRGRREDLCGLRSIKRDKVAGPDMCTVQRGVPPKSCTTLTCVFCDSLDRPIHCLRPPAEIEDETNWLEAIPLAFPLG